VKLNPQQTLRLKKRRMMVNRKSRPHKIIFVNLKVKCGK
jgi:hypothetical protein